MERDYYGERGVFFAHFIGPERQSIADLEAELRRLKSTPLASKSSGRPPGARPKVRRPRDSESIVAACLANSAVFDRSGAMRMSVTSSIRGLCLAPFLISVAGGAGHPPRPARLPRRAGRL